MQDRSIIFCPFNSNEENEELEHPLFDDIDFQTHFVKHSRKVIRFGAQCSDVNRQYEKNNNAELDNGIINACMH